MSFVKKLASLVREELAEIAGESEPSSASPLTMPRPTDEQPASDSHSAESEAISAYFERRVADFETTLKQVGEERSFYRRRSEEYFALIERLEAQRNEWNAMWKRDSAGHQQAQAMLQEALIFARQQLRQVVSMVNQHRVANGLEVIDVSKLDVNAPPVGIAEDTAAFNAKELAAAPVDIDRETELRRINEKVPVPSQLAEGSTAPESPSAPPAAATP